MEYFEFLGFRVSTFQISAVLIEYKIMQDNYYSFIPNNHLKMLIEKLSNEGLNPEVSFKNAKDNHTRVWRSLLMMYPFLADIAPQDNVAEIIIDCEDCVEHWFIPIL